MKENSRLTWKELGERVHLTGQAVRARVERLVEGKKIRRFTMHDETAFITMYGFSE
ncbi:AsnC family transcriptional regulator [Sporolactobacillus sp. KGMB 08714]|uniref:AsnC family transcriptional regulator n=1 Tax=Sporolactobacillus sp. KGMB 08714 TaxID=3064704 RepID=UPI003FA7DDC1